jgi:hypothetical protein
MGVLRQAFVNSIYCDSCKTRWISAELANMKKSTTDDWALKCKACDNNAPLIQQYPNAIQCTKCGTKWTNGSLNQFSQFGKNMRGYRASKYKSSRANW